MYVPTRFRYATYCSPKNRSNARSSPDDHDGGGDDDDSDDNGGSMSSDSTNIQHIALLTAGPIIEEPPQNDRINPKREQVLKHQLCA